jgi:hypothetical protein
VRAVTDFFLWRILSALFTMTYGNSALWRLVMEGKRITGEELVAELEGDIKMLAEKIADSINNAKPGRIIAESEEPVRDAHAVFRQQAYQKAMDLLSKRLAEEDFSPSAHRGGKQVEK